MELELSLGDSPAPVKANISPAPALTGTCQEEEDQDLVLGLGVTATERADQDSIEREETVEEEDKEASAQTGVYKRRFSVVDGRAWIARSLSPPSMHMDVPVRLQGEASEDEENGGGRVRKKLRLSKEQSAFLEDSFKEHSALTLEQKNYLANRLSLRPRQVEVWFQNRRARTKLKQTEVDCEYLKHWCETLARENRKLQREVAELRAFRAPAYPLYGHHLLSTVLPVPACPSCDSKASPVGGTTLSTVTAVPSPGPAAASPPSTLFPRPHFGRSFTVSHPVLRRRPSATS